MYDYNIIEDPDFMDDYIYKSRNEFNQILQLEIYRYDERCFYVTFFITTKRVKGYQSLKQTGKDGIKSLLWTKYCIIDFIDKFKDKYHRSVIKIYADDVRRLNVYERGLTEIGFKKSYTKPKYLYYVL